MLEIENKVLCPICGSMNINKSTKDGKGKECMLCKDCRFYFTEEAAVIKKIRRNITCKGCFEKKNITKTEKGYVCNTCGTICVYKEKR